ncbi:MAG: hypothetical protein M3Q71_22875 [Chloroflexota bacterium]|nr:hypothetical protein [Chloroflexota bacterium]
MDARQTRQELSRRTVLRLGAGIGAGLALGASMPRSSVLAQSTPSAATPVPGENVVVMVGDVVDFTLEPEGRWPAPVGSVTLTMHPGFFDGQDAWFIRTDASDQAFAQEQGLVYVPLLKNALQAEGSHANIYLFAEGTDGQRAVVSTIPGRDDFTSAFRIHHVIVNGESEVLNSVEAIASAEQSGTVRVEQTDIVVNYPLVVWPGGSLPVDEEMAAPLGTGPLIEAPDTTSGTVTFKLHQCYPGSRYIATDTSSAPMAPMMGIVPSVPTQKLVEAKATAPIYVFGNGLKGTGAMGFQPAVFNAKAGDVTWSPFWDHKTVVWKDESAATLLTSEAEIMARAEAGEVEIFNGVPDSHPNGFVVNCPAPILAPTTYDPALFALAEGTPTARR